MGSLRSASTKVIPSDHLHGDCENTYHTEPGARPGQRHFGRLAKFVAMEEELTKEALRAALEAELTGEMGKKYLDDLEKAANDGIESSFDGFVPTNEPILDVEHWTKQLELNLPLNWEATSILVPPSALRAGQEHRIENKRHLRFWDFVSSMRIRDDHNLPSVAKVVTLASRPHRAARGPVLGPRRGIGH